MSSTGERRLASRQRLLTPEPRSPVGCSTAAWATELGWGESSRSFKREKFSV